MALVEFSLGEMGELDDGRVAVAWKQALQRVLLDCEDRPGASDARKVNLQMEVKPIVDEGGELADVRVAFQVKDSIPTRKSKVYSMDIRRVGGAAGRQLIFNNMAEDNIDQRTLDETDGFDG